MRKLWGWLRNWWRPLVGGVAAVLVVVLSLFRRKQASVSDRLVDSVAEDLEEASTETEKEIEEQREVSHQLAKEADEIAKKQGEERLVAREDPLPPVKEDGKVPEVEDLEALLHG